MIWYRMWCKVGQQSLTSTSLISASPINGDDDDCDGDWDGDCDGDCDVDDDSNSNDNVQGGFYENYLT